MRYVAVVMILAAVSYAADRWQELAAKNETTDVPAIVFKLPGESTSSSVAPWLVIVCSDSKWKATALHTGGVTIDIADKRPAFLKAPQQQVHLDFDSTSESRFFDIAKTSDVFFLDRHTTEKIVHAGRFRVQFRAARGTEEVFSFSPAETETERIREACGMDQPPSAARQHH